MSTLGKIFKARKLILEGVLNTIVRDEFVETVAAYRNSICDGCEHKGDDCVRPGTQPCCGACGCSLKFKVRSPRAACGLLDIGKEPKWLPVIDKKTQDKFDALDNGQEPDEE